MKKSLKIWAKNVIFGNEKYKKINANVARIWSAAPETKTTLSSAHICRKTSSVETKIIQADGGDFWRLYPSCVPQTWEEWHHESPKDFFKREYLLGLFSQVLDADGGCKEVIRKLQSYASIKGIKVPSSSTASYCTARRQSIGDRPRFSPLFMGDSAFCIYQPSSVAFWLIMAHPKYSVGQVVRWYIWQLQRCRPGSDSHWHRFGRFWGLRSRPDARSGKRVLATRIFSSATIKVPSDDASTKLLYFWMDNFNRYSAAFLFSSIRLIYYFNMFYDFFSYVFAS